MAQVTSEPMRSWPEKIWDSITSPNAVITEVGQQRQARLVSMLAFALVVSTLIGILSSIISNRGMQSPYMLPLMMICGLSLVAYLISRTPGIMIAGSIIIYSLALVGFISVYQGLDTSQSLWFYLSLAYLIAVGVYKWRGMIIMTVFNLALLSVMPQLIPGIDGQENGVMLGLVLLAGVLSTALVFVQTVVERARHAELHEANQNLQKMGALLEQRVDERTRDIALAAELGRQISMLQDVRSLLNEAVERIRQHFDLYYTQIYLVDPTERSLILRAGTGEVGRELMRRSHRLVIDLTSINGTAAVERRAVLVEDTAHNPVFRSNVLLPDTRSELAIPLISGDRVLGVLNLQSSMQGGIQDANLPVFETLAGQLATALVNADLHEQTRRSLEEAETRSRQVTQQGWQDYLNAVEVPERIAYLYDQQKIQPLVDPIQQAADPCTLTAPIKVAGAQVGVFQFNADRPWSSEDADLAAVVAQQVAQQVESLRLLGQAERYRREAQEAIRRLTREEWESYLTQTEEGNLAFFYADGQVKPLQEAQNGHANLLHFDIHVQDQSVGELALGGVASLSAEDQDLLNVIGEQLGGHLENMRLYRSAQQELTERQKTEQALRESETNLSVALQIAGMGSWEFDLDSNQLWLSREHLIMMGIEPQDNQGLSISVEEFGQQYVFAEDQAVIFAAITNAREAILNPDYQDKFEYRLITADGSLRSLSVATRKKIGSPAVVIGTSQDVTEARKTQELVTKRASELAMVSQVATTVSTIQTPEEMLQTVVDLTKEAFNLYHAHVYLLSDEGQTLQLTKGAGSIGRQMVAEGRQIQLGAEKSLVARAARAKKGIIVNDVTVDPDFLPHPLLPHTRSEMAIPLIAGDRVLGVLDIQSEVENRFSEEDISIQTTLAAQVAVSLQNARSYIRAQRQAEREALINAISERIQATNTVESALQVAVREIGRALGAQHTAVRLGLDHNRDQ